MTKKSEITLQAQISELRGIVITGFEGVHARQDITNGRIAKAETRIEHIEKKDTFEDGEKKGITWVWKIVIGAIIIIISILALFSASGCWNIVCNAKP